MKINVLKDASTFARAWQLGAKQSFIYSFILQNSTTKLLEEDKS